MHPFKRVALILYSFVNHDAWNEIRRRESLAGTDHELVDQLMKAEHEYMKAIRTAERLDRQIAANINHREKLELPATTRDAERIAPRLKELQFHLQLLQMKRTEADSAVRSAHNDLSAINKVVQQQKQDQVLQAVECIHVREDELVFTIYGTTLTTRTDVYYRKGGKTFRRGEDAWIDMLCTCIHQEIVKAEQPHDADIAITFEDQSQIFISLRSKDRTRTPAVQLEINHEW